MASQSFSDTKVLALFSAYMTFISLAFVITAMHVVRFFVRRSRPTFGRTGYVKRLVMPKNQRARVVSNQPRRAGVGILTAAQG
jgi:hypothetical protein